MKTVYTPEAGKTFFKQLLITSAYLKQLLKNDENIAVEVDGKTVSAASLRHDIEEVVTEFFDKIAAKADKSEEG